MLRSSAKGDAVVVGRHDIRHVAATLFSVPIAIVSLVDEDRIWFKARHGIDVRQIDREPGLCASAILQDHPYIVEDAKKDLRALANPLVAGEFGLRFYAAAQLRTREGFNLGTLCVIDREPRRALPEKIKQLEHLAAIVMDQMELRLAARRAVAEATAATRLDRAALKRPASSLDRAPADADRPILFGSGGAEDAENGLVLSS
jgi:GAF domain-containing protein